MVTQVTQANFKKEVISSDKPVIIDFWAAWCVPCQMMAPVFESLSKELPMYKFVKVNVDEEQGLAEEYLISGIPCVVIIKGGVEIGRIIGFKQKQALGLEIKEVIMNEEMGM